MDLVLIANGTEIRLPVPNGVAIPGPGDMIELALDGEQAAKGTVKRRRIIWHPNGNCTIDLESTASNGEFWIGDFEP